MIAPNPFPPPPHHTFQGMQQLSIQILPPLTDGSTKSPDTCHRQVYSFSRIFPLQVTKDRVHILATEIDLDDASPLIDPCKDFYLEAVTLRIKVCTSKYTEEKNL